MPYSKVYVTGILLEIRPVSNQLDAESLFLQDDDLHLCTVAMGLKDYTEEYFTASLRRHAVIRDKTYFSSNCLTTVQTGNCISFP